MDERPKKRCGPLLWLAARSRRFWIVVVLAPLLYVASVGPACWITSHAGIGGNWLFNVYAPFIWVLNGSGPDFLYDPTVWYSLAGVADGWGWEIDPSGDFVRFGPPH